MPQVRGEPWALILNLVLRQGLSSLPLFSGLQASWHHELPGFSVSISHLEAGELELQTCATSSFL